MTFLGGEAEFYFFNKRNVAEMRKVLSKKWFAIAASTLVFSCMVAVGGYLAFLEQEHCNFQQRQDVLNQASHIRTALENQVNTTLNLAMGLVVFVSTYPEFSTEEFNLMAHNLMQRAPHIRNIGLARNNVITHMYPLKGNEKALGLRYMEIPEQADAVKRTIAERTMVIAGPVDLVQGGRGFISRVPVFDARDKEKYWGIASLVIDMDRFYSDTGLSDKDGKIEFALRGMDGLGFDGQLFYGKSELFADAGSVIMPIALPSGEWILAARLKNGYPASALARLTRGMGCLIAIVVSLLLFALLRSYDQIHYMALHDHLTGLMNHRLFDEYLKQCIEAAKRKESLFAVLYLDLDKFKPINDTYGHRQGDTVLVAVADRLRECLRTSDIITRIGGDEFAAILPDIASGKACHKVVARIRAAISKPVYLSNGEKVSVEVSIGVSIYPENGECVEGLIKYADLDMYLHKHQKKTKSE